MIAFLAQITPETPESFEGLSIADLLLKGGIVMIPIILLLFLATYLFIERFLYIRQKAKQQKDLVQNITRMIKDSDIKAATMFAERETSSTGRILASGLQYIGRPMKEIEGVMESTANVEVGEMEKGTGYLGIIAGIAPMLGFIGTISGIIRIFYTISLSDNISIGIIAGGLYEKMITSGAGLVVGVLAYTGYHILNQMIQNFTLRAQRDSLEFIRYIMSPAS
ncbi:MAG: MotA/TolQ/ExbB proton channel family protein [Cyclobacteriaceae bacterium]|nr:MotA/TolQ/ExbB proton channel family protein [Cyclobacteriaceae bacterium]